MEQEVRTEQELSSFTRKIVQTTYKVNVFFSKNSTATGVEDTLPCNRKSVDCDVMFSKDQYYHLM